MQTIKHNGSSERPLLSLICIGGGEWILNVVTFWVRPIYRKMIKTEKGRKIAYRLGNVKWVKDLIFCFCLTFQTTFILTLIGIAAVLEMLGFESLYNILLMGIIVYLFLGSFVLLVSFSNTMLIDSVLLLESHENSCLWFSNPEDFCKYHDGYFRKEKLVYRMWLHLDEKNGK